MAVRPSQNWHCNGNHSSHPSLKGWLIVKGFSVFCIFLYKGVKGVFFKNSTLKYTGVPAHICTDVNREMGETTRGGGGGGWMLKNEQFKQTGKRWRRHTLKVQLEVSELKLLLNHKDVRLTCTTTSRPPLCRKQRETRINQKHAAAAKNLNSQSCWVRFKVFLWICKVSYCKVVKYIWL